MEEKRWEKIGMLKKVGDFEEDLERLVRNQYRFEPVYGETEYFNEWGKFRWGLPVGLVVVLILVVAFPPH